MAKVVQLSRGDRANQDAYTGPEGELTSDTSTPELRLHDGVVAGGHRVLPLPENDLRYQAVDVELTQISALAAGPGFMVKRADGDYRLRVLQGTAGEITVVDGNGFGNDPVVSLPDTITATLTFSGVATFSQSILGSLTGNVTGNLIGDSAGIHTGAVVGDVVGDLAGNATGSHAGTFTGNIDTLAGSVNFAAGQIPDSALASAFVKPGDPFLVPSGGIIMWSGAIGAIPSGWLLCDGTTGTPDLRDRFVIGAGTTHNPDAIGGSETHIHAAQLTDSQGAHTHAVTVDPHTLVISEMPIHAHGSGIGGQANDSGVAVYSTQTATATREVKTDAGTSTLEPLTESLGGGGSHGHTGSTASGGAHTHTNPATPALDHKPPFYALAYIMKS